MLSFENSTETEEPDRYNTAKPQNLATILTLMGTNTQLRHTPHTTKSRKTLNEKKINK